MTAAKKAPALSVVPPAPAPANLPFEQAKLDRWFELSNDLLPALQAEEKALRLELFEKGFPAPEVGTNRLALGHGKDLVCTYKLNYRIDREAMSEHSEGIDSELFHSVIKFKPEISVGAWNKLSPDELRLFGPFVTETPGTPSLEIKNKKR